MKKSGCKMLLGYHVNISFGKPTTWQAGRTVLRLSPIIKGFLGRTWMMEGLSQIMKTKARGDFHHQQLNKAWWCWLYRFGDSTKWTPSRNPPYPSSQFESLTIVTLLNLRHSFLKRYTLIAPSGGRESTSKRRSVIFSIKSFILVPAGAAVASPEED